MGYYMKLFLYVKIFILIFINCLLLATSLSGTVIIDSTDKNFNFNGKSLLIVDISNNFGSVKVTSAGSFVFPKTVVDNKNHVYSLKLTQLPDNNGYICTINQASGTVFIHDKTDLVVSCKGKYYISVNVLGLSNGDTYTLADGNEILSFNTNSTQSFIQWYYANITYSFKPTFNYTTLNYKRCSNNTNGTITNNLTIYIICNTSTFNQVDYQPKARYSSVSWKDSSGNAYIFGGFNGVNYYNDLWKFNGTSWFQVIANGSTGSPSGRDLAVVWTDNAGNVYMFGGYNGSTYLNDLWRFNGLVWSQVIANGILGSPSRRYLPVAWTDNAGNAYVFGGWNGSTYLNDLWRFNGIVWFQVIANGTVGSPSGRDGAVSWTDNAGNAYVFGGYHDYSYLNDLWKFNGTSWSPVTNEGTQPSVRSGAVAWTDNAGNGYVFGGEYGPYLNDLWKFDGTNWFQVIANGAVGSPSGRNGAVAWTDNAGNAYVFGGYSRTYINDLWKITNNTMWTQLTNIANAPSARYDSVSWNDSFGNAYVFGGRNGSIYLNDLWKFNGISWFQVIDNGTLNSPSVRSGAVAWTDNAGNSYMFGGWNGSTYYNDLWKFNGKVWFQVFANGIVGSPSGRYQAVTWTDNIGNAYVFSGNNGSYINDLWRFNGKVWFQVFANGSVGSPSGRCQAVAWTDNAGNAYVFGGNNGSYINDLWKFNGSWSEVTNGIGTPPSVRSGAVAWTDNAGNAYVFGGNNGSYLNDLWKFNGRWSQVSYGVDTPLSIRSGAVVWTDNVGKAYVFGGYNGGSYLNDLFVI